MAAVLPSREGEGNRGRRSWGKKKKGDEGEQLCVVCSYGNEKNSNERKKEKRGRKRRSLRVGGRKRERERGKGDQEGREEVHAARCT